MSTIAFGTDTGTVTFDGQTIPVPADKPTLNLLAQPTGGTFHTATSVEELTCVYTNIGSQIGYTTVHRDISWRFLAIGLLFVLAAARPCCGPDGWSRRTVTRHSCRRRAAPMGAAPLRVAAQADPG